MATIKPISHYDVKSGDVFFFDNNVWMFIFSGIAGTKLSKQQAYSNLLKKIRSTRATIFINSLVLSEYANRNLKLSYEQWKTREISHGNTSSIKYKEHYRKTKDFKSAKEDTNNEINEILKITEKKPDDFNALNISKILNVEGLDFNDSYYAEYCELNKFILVSDDGDFAFAPNNIVVLKD